MSASCCFCCVLPLIKSRAHHLIWPVNLQPRTRRLKSPTGWKLKFSSADVCTFAIVAHTMDVCVWWYITVGTTRAFSQDCSFLVVGAGMSCKINSSLNIAQSTVPNPLRFLLVMIYSARIKEISGTPEYICCDYLWQTLVTRQSE